MESSNFQSEFNYAVKKLEAIRSLENTAVQRSLDEDYNGWLKVLKALYRELSPYMGRSHEECEEALIEAVKAVKVSTPRNPSLKEEKLTDLDIALKQVLHSAGMDLPKKSDPTKAVIE